MNERRYLPKVFINIYLRSFETVRTHKYGPRTLSLTFGRTQFWSAVIDFGSRVFFSAWRRLVRGLGFGFQGLEFRVSSATPSCQIPAPGAKKKAPKVMREHG